MADGDYITEAQVKALFDSETELSYLTGDSATGTVDEADLDDAIEYAEGEINVRVGVRYKTPVSSTETSVNEFLRRVAADLCFYRLMARKPPVSDTTTDRRTHAIETLDKIAEGDLVLPGAVTAASTVSRGDLLDYSDASRTASSNSGRSFTRETMGRL